MFNLLSELARLPDLESFPSENLAQYDDPGFLVYWKDLNGKIKGANNSFAKSAGLDQIDDALGKTDLELYAPVSAKIFKDNDHKILATRQAALFVEPIIAITENNSPVIALTYKRPLYSQDGKALGLSGVSFLLSLYELSVHETISSLLKGRPENNVYSETLLSKREKEVLYYISRGMSAKHSAKLMDISPRTVEKHIDNIKIKMGVTHKGKLIEKAFQHFQLG